MAGGGLATGDPARPAAEAARARWPGTRVEAVVALAGDASARRYVRLRLAGGGAPPTAIAMLLPAGQAHVPEEITGGAPEMAELPFVAVQRVLEAHGIPVPAIYASDVPAGFLLLEDVGDLALADAALASDADGRARLFGAAVDTLADLAVLGVRKDVDLAAFGSPYGRELIARELDVVVTHGLASPDAGSPRPTGSDPEIDRALVELGDSVAAQPRVLMHRDYHAWNLHVDPQGRLRVIDFQDAVPGPALYDLASLCTDRDSDRFVDAALESALLARFAKALDARGGPRWRDAADLRLDYLDAVAYRTLRVIGRFRFLALEKGKTAYLRFLPGMARQTRRALRERGRDHLATLLAERATVFA